MRKQGYWGYFFTFPFIIHIVVFVAFPVVFSAYLSFAKWDLFNPPEWIGMDNWTRLAGNREFWVSIRNVFFLALVYVPLKTILSLVIAHSLNKSLRGKTLYRLFYFLPVVTPWLAGGLLWTWLYNTKYGMINWLLSFFGLGPVQWLDSRSWWLVIGSIAITSVWKGLGTTMILLLAGLQNISKEMHEAAQIDGASGWKHFSKIVFPLISPIVYLVMILSTIGAFQAFDVFLAMLSSIPSSIPERNMVPNMLIYRDAFILAKMGPASAAAWALLLIILTITLFQRYFEKRWVHYE